MRLKEGAGRGGAEALVGVGQTGVQNNFLPAAGEPGQAGLKEGAGGAYGRRRKGVMA